MPKVLKKKILKKSVKSHPKSATEYQYYSLGHRLIEYKLMYYYPHLVREEYHDYLTISDDEYDKLEVKYLKMCRELDLPNTIVHKEYAGIRTKGKGMFEVDFTRPVVHLILRKYGIDDWQGYNKGEK